MKTKNSEHILLRGTLMLCILFTSLQLLAQSPKKALKQAKVFLAANQYDSAIKALNIAIDFKPNSVKPYVMRAEAYEATKRISAAANDYLKASAISPTNKEYSYNAGRLLYDLGRHIEAIRMFNLSIDQDEKYLPPYIVKIKSLIALKNYPEALLISDQTLYVKKTAENYFYHGQVAELMKDDVVAERDYRNSIRTDDKFKESYIGLAHVLTRQNKTDEALGVCHAVLGFFPNYMEGFLTRSNIYYRKSDLLNALSDMSATINLNGNVDSFYLIRAEYQHALKQFDKSIGDYTKAISINPNYYWAFYKRAQVHEEMQMIKEASDDYKMFLKLTSALKNLVAETKNANEKIYDLNAETVKPTIELFAPFVRNDGSIEIALDAKSVVLEGIVKDQSRLESVSINQSPYEFESSQDSLEFKREIQVVNFDKITITATDIYHNTATKVYPIKRTEIDPPLIDIITPYTSDFNEIFLESEEPTVFIEGKIADESLIKSITVDGVEAKFYIDKLNPTFSATINVAGKDKIVVKAVDDFGNVAEKTFKLDRESARILSSNPMGKTWVIFIENSDYESFASLEGPAKDISTMRAALSKYDIHNIIEKRNMTKAQMEKFFSIELRDLVKNQKVNSLMVWYAGHGKFINETGYWIPTNAKRDEEFTYFNVNSLKAYMQSYTKYVTHVLVVTDACESGPSFYAAMRGAKNRSCGDSTPTTLKSSQVFSSAGHELAADNSPFTKTFAKSLDYNTSGCIAIDNIVVTVTESISQGAKQSPKFGKIQGLEDEDGTFYFIKKSR